MENNFMLDGKSSIVVYGAGEIGKNYIDKVLSKFFKLEYILDSKLDGETYKNIPIFSLENSELSFLKKENLVVIICLANGMIHKKVANLLYEKGYQYIVFLPTAFKMNTEQKCCLIKQYNDILNGNVKFPLNIINYENWKDTHFDVNDVIIREETEEFLAWINTGLLFTETLEKWTGDKGKVHAKDDFQDKNIASCYWYLNLFGYISGKNENYDDYKNLFVKNLKDLNIDILEREELFYIFKQELNKGTQFFIEGAPQSVWNEKGYFNLVGGHHRTLFLLSQGHNCFPVRMKKRDFQLWCNNKAIDQIKHFIKKNNIEFFKCPVYHPAFVNFQTENENVCFINESDIYKYYGCRSIQGKKIVDLSDSEGFYSRLFQRLGNNEIICYAYNDRNRELMKLLNELTYTSKIHVKRYSELLFEDLQKYNLSIVMDKISRQTSNEEKLLWLRYIDKTTDYEMLWESNEDFESDKLWVMANSGFDECKVLNNKVINGKMSTLAVFSKNGI